MYLPWWFIPLVLVFWGSIAFVVAWTATTIVRGVAGELRVHRELDAMRPDAMPRAQIVTRRR